MFIENMDITALYINRIILRSIAIALKNINIDRFTYGPPNTHPSACKCVQGNLELTRFVHIQN